MSSHQRKEGMVIGMVLETLESTRWRLCLNHEISNRLHQIDVEPTRG